LKEGQNDHFSGLSHYATGALDYIVCMNCLDNCATGNKKLSAFHIEYLCYKIKWNLFDDSLFSFVGRLYSL